MVDCAACWNRANHQLIGHTVSPLRFPLKREAAITAAGGATSPYPAIAGLVDFRPEAFFGGRMRGHREALLPGAMQRGGPHRHRCAHSSTTVQGLQPHGLHV
jgi:hypothetical protein